MKRIILIIITCFTFILTGCVFNNPKYINIKSKPNNYYYSNQIYKKLKNEETYKLKVFDNNLYRYYDVSPEDNDIILSFLESLNTDNYINDADTKSRPRYELSIEFPDTKYIINAYSSDLISIYPWDGNFQADILNMKGVSPRNNIYDFCTYTISKAHEN